MTILALVACIHRPSLAIQDARIIRIPDSLPLFTETCASPPVDITNTLSVTGCCLN
jgi:hypothetical protein